MSRVSKDLGILALRVTAGAIALGHGYPKLFGGAGKKSPDVMNRIYGTNYPQAVETGGIAGFAGALKHMKYPAPTVSAYAAAISEFAGGLGLVAGVGGPLPALALAGTMVGASNAHKSTGLYGQGGMEFALLLGAAAGAVAILGPGKFSLDARFGRRSKHS